MQLVNFAFESYNRSSQHNTIRKRVPYTDSAFTTEPVFTYVSALIDVYVRIVVDLAAAAPLRPL